MSCRLQPYLTSVMTTATHNIHIKQIEFYLFGKNLKGRNFFYLADNDLHLNKTIGDLK